ncbi:G-protein coupled receptor Mth2-like [Vanessa cardui]|uniref:G-protein coupled receptor Mth2-like n=1 Tax=Vanessa cardui TaxID=171605 RepID=UPI001F12C19D|nr:G-protein coupled receptor Mth2-like [Vanessa cardui]
MYFKLHFIFIIVILISVSSGLKKSDKKPYISKCCPAKYYVYNLECRFNGTSDKDFSDVDVFNSNRTRIGSLRDNFQIISGNFRDLIPNLPNLHFYINENGNLDLLLQQPNSAPEVTTVNNDKFCVDYDVTSDTFSPIFGAIFEEEPQKDTVFTITALLTSSTFLLLVLIIYTILQELRNLKGKILMAIVFSLMSAFVLLATLKIIYNDTSFQASEEFCYGFTSSIYFFFLSALSWMNVMSFDIWWTLRSMTTRRTVRRRGGHYKFTIYCIYGWGIPLAMAIGLIAIDVSEIPTTIIKPNIILNGCFLADKPKLVYMDIPMLLLISSNWIFFLVTAYNFWCFGRESELLYHNNANKHRKQKERFLVYLKLSIVMGISWITEVISTFIPNLMVWYITDAYNMFIGIAIFFIFVFKKDIRKKLSQRFLCSPAAPHKTSLFLPPTPSSSW